MRALMMSSLSALRDWRLWVLQFVGNIVLFAAFAGWLHIPEEHWWQLACSAVIALLLVLCFLWMQAGTLAAFPRSTEEGAKCPFRPALKHLFAFLVWLVVLVVLLRVVDHWIENDYQVAAFLTSKMPSWMRQAFGWNFYAWVQRFFVVVYWYIVPGLLLPFGAMAVRGLNREALRGALRTLRSIWYWLFLLIFVLLGVYLPKLLIDWTPESTLTKETISMVLRLLVAYGLAIGYWLMTASLVSHVAVSKTKQELA